MKLKLQYKKPNKKISELTVQEFIDLFETLVDFYIPKQYINYSELPLTGTLIPQKQNPKWMHEVICNTSANI